MKVICIRADSPLVLDDIYTVIEIRPSKGYLLEEVKPPPGFRSFDEKRFRTIEEKGDMFIEEFITIDEEKKQCLNYP